MTLTHLQRLEAEAIHIMREAVPGFERPAIPLPLPGRRYWPRAAYSNSRNR